MGFLLERHSEFKSQLVAKGHNTTRRYEIPVSAVKEFLKEFEFGIIPLAVIFNFFLFHSGHITAKDLFKIPRIFLYIFLVFLI